MFDQDKYKTAEERVKAFWDDHKTIIGTFHNEAIDAILRAARGEGGAE